MHYFFHDVDASRDEKILALRIENGGAAVDAYWAVIEQLYRIEGPWTIAENQPETKAVCFWLGLGYLGFLTYVKGMIATGLLDQFESGENREVDTVSLEQATTLTVYSPRVMEQVEKHHERAETARQNGKKGGRPKGSKTQENPVGTESGTQGNPAVTQAKTNKNKNKNKNINKNTSVFIRPTIDEITAYAVEKGYEGFDSERFWNYFEAQGWKLSNGIAMKSWKAAMANWHSRSKKRTGVRPNEGRFDDYNDW